MNLFFEKLENELLKENFSNQEVLQILNVIRKVNKERCQKASQTLRNRVKAGLDVGRPKFQKPLFFKYICIFQELGYMDLKTITKMLNISKSTYFKYKFEEKITSTDLKNNLFKKPTEKQINLFNQYADLYIKEWVQNNQNGYFKKFNLLNDFISECKVSIYLRLPRFNDSFKSFCKNVCYEVSQEFLQRNKSTVKGKNIDFNDRLNDYITFNYTKGEK